MVVTAAHVTAFIGRLRERRPGGRPGVSVFGLTWEGASARVRDVAPLTLQKAVVEHPANVPGASGEIG